MRNAATRTRTYIPVVGILFAASVIGACATSPTSPQAGTPEAPRLHLIVDDSPTWSPDSRVIAYHRRFASSYGPPGVYVVNSSGGPSRLVTAGGFLGPSGLRFSPDGTQLVGSWAGQLVFIDLPNGNVRFPMFTDNGAVQPDWSADGQSVIYARSFLDPGESRDSVGLHLFDVATGLDRPMNEINSVVFGAQPRWSPSGEEILLVGSAPPLSPTVGGLFVVGADGSNLHLLSKSPAGRFYNELQWYRRGHARNAQAVFRESGGIRPARTLTVNTADGEVRPWRMNLSRYSAFSADGRYVALMWPQPTDSLGVLFVQIVDDVLGITRRQITAWEPAGLAAAGSR